MNDKVRIGLLGYGKVAGLHAEALAEATGGQLVSVAGRNTQKRGEFAGRWKIASRENIEEMVRQDMIDAVIIATPHPQHCEGALEAFAAGVHVLVEKPMAITEAECDKMIAASKKAGKILSVVSQRRWFPACRRIKNAIIEGKLGRPILAQVTILGWRDRAYYESDPWRGKWDTEGGGVIINQAPHQIDLMLWYMGPFEKIHGFWDNFNHPYIEVEDSAAAVVRFKNNGIGSVLLSNSQNPGLYAKVHIHGSAAWSVGVQTDGGSMFIPGRSGITEPPLNDLWTIPGETELLEKFRAEDEAFFKTINPTIHFFTCQIEDFCGAIIENRPPESTGEQGKETVRFIETLLKTGKPQGASQ